MKHNKKILTLIMVCITLSFSGYSFAYDLKPVVLNPEYKHDRFNTQPKDIARFFRAYTVFFDGADDNNNDGTADKWGIPEWVAYELHKAPQGLGKGPKRPSKWMTDIVPS
jgi:hypothetical protein